MQRTIGKLALIALGLGVGSQALAASAVAPTLVYKKGDSHITLPGGVSADWWDPFTGTGSYTHWQQSKPSTALGYDFYAKVADYAGNGFNLPGSKYSGYDGVCVTYRADNSTAWVLEGASYTDQFQVVLAPTSGAFLSQYVTWDAFTKSGVSMGASDLGSRQKMVFNSLFDAQKLEHHLEIVQVGLGSACNANNNPAELIIVQDPSESANNTSAGAVALTTTAQSANLHNASDIDFYSITLASDKLVTVQLTELAGFDAQVDIIASNGSTVLKTGHTGADYAVAVSKNLAAGTYFAKVSAPYAASSYKLAFSVADPLLPQRIYSRGDADVQSTPPLAISDAGWFGFADSKGSDSKWFAAEPSVSNEVDALLDLSALADSYTGIGVNWSLSDIGEYTGICLAYRSDAPVSMGLVSKDDDKKKYNYYANELQSTNGAFRSVLVPWSQFAQLDPQGTLVELAYALSNNIGIRFQNRNTGKAHLEIAQMGFGNACDASSNTPAIVADASESNNTVATASLLATSLTNRNLHLPSDVDYYSFTLADTKYVEASLENLVGFGAKIELLKSDGTTVLKTDSVAGGEDAQIGKTLLAGTYLLRVSGPYVVRNYDIVLNLSTPVGSLSLYKRGAGSLSAGSPLNINSSSIYSFADKNGSSVQWFTGVPSSSLEIDALVRMQDLNGNFAGLGSDWQETDFSDFTGVCMTYRSDAEAKLLMVATGDVQRNYNSYGVTLSSTQGAFVSKLFSWADFAQVDPNGDLVDKDYAISHLTGLRIQNIVGGAAHVEIAQMGVGNACDATSNTPALSQDASEPNETYTAATALTTALTSRSLHNASDADFYKIILADAKFLSVALSVPASFGLQAELLGSDGVTVLRKGAVLASTSSSSLALQRNLPAGTYYVKITSAYPVKSYDISYTASAAPADQLVWSKNVHGAAHQVMYNSLPGGFWSNVKDVTDYASASIENAFVVNSANVAKGWVVSGGAKLGATGKLGYAGVAFDWTTNASPADLGSHTGVCVTYRSPKAVRLRLHQGVDASEAIYGEDLAAATQFTSQFIEFSDLDLLEGTASFDVAEQMGLQIVYDAGSALSSTTIEIAQVGLGDVCTVNAADLPTGLVPNPLAGMLWTTDLANENLDLGTNGNGGSWFVFNDKQDKGSSTVSKEHDWAGVEVATGVLGARISVDLNAYVGLGVNLRSNSGAVNVENADNGLCVTYRSRNKIFAELQSSNKVSWDGFRTELPIHTEFTSEFIPFTAFQQQGWGYAQILDTKLISTLQFMDTTSNSASLIEIAQVGVGNGCAAQEFELVANHADVTISENEDAFAAKVYAVADWFRDRDGDIFSLSIEPTANLPVRAELVNGVLTISPLANQYGIGKVTLKATNADGEQASIDLDVDIASVIDNEVLADDHYTIPEGEPLVVDGVAGVLANDVANDGSLSIVSFSSLAGLTLSGNGAFTFAAVDEAHGDYVFSYRTANDNAQVTITVVPVNAAPTLGTLAPIVLDEDFGDYKVPSADWKTYSDKEDAADYAKVEASGDQVVSALINAQGELVLRSLTDATGTGIVTLVFTDKGDGSAVAKTVTGQMTVTINKVDNDPPIAVSDAYTVDEDGSLTISTQELLANDYDPDGATVSLDVGSIPATIANGTLVLNGANLVFTPVLNWHGTTSFTYKVTSSNGVAEESSDPAMVVITVNSVNDAPVVVSVPADGIKDEDFDSFERSLVGVFADVDHATLEYSVSVSGVSANATVSVDKLVVSSVANASGKTTITVTAQDQGTPALKVSTSFVIDVNAVNDPLEATATSIADAALVDGFAPYSVDLSTYFHDNDAEAIAYSCDVQPATLLQVTCANGVLSVTGMSGQLGSAVITITATAGAESKTLSQNVLVSSAESAVKPSFAHAASDWRSRVQDSRHGMAVLTDMQGRVLWRANLPLAASVIDQQLARSQDLHVLHVGEQSWLLAPGLR